MTLNFTNAQSTMRPVQFNSTSSSGSVVLLALEFYRPATIELSKVHFWIVEPPHRICEGDDRWLVIDSGEVSALDKAPAIDLPEVPQTVLVSWLYVREQNSFIYVAAENAGYRWTGPEEDHA